MALGALVPNPALTLTMTGMLAFTCLVDGTAISAGPADLPIAPSGLQTTWFAVVCPTCHTRYLVSVSAPATALTVQQTS